MCQLYFYGARWQGYERGLSEISRTEAEAKKGTRLWNKISPIGEVLYYKEITDYENCTKINSSPIRRGCLAIIGKNFLKPYAHFSLRSFTRFHTVLVMPVFKQAWPSP